MGIAAFYSAVIVKQPSSDNTPYEKIGDEVRSLADEVPFDIPDSWEWVRLGSIVYNRGQITPSTDLPDFSELRDLPSTPVAYLDFI